MKLWLRLKCLSDLQVRLTFGQMDCLANTSVVAKCVTTSVRLTSGQINPPLGKDLGQVDIFIQSSGQATRDILWSSVLLHQSGWPLVRCAPTGWVFGWGWHLVRLNFGFFPIAFPICDYKSSSEKVLPWCHNTPDWWGEDMHKLVWIENSLDSISLHFVQEYVIRWHRYKTANGPCK